MTTKTQTRGYSYKIVKQIQGADPANPAVRLGQLCVAKDISVAEIAEALGVSRQAVYMWFIGLYRPREEHLQKINHLLTVYSQDAAAS